MMSTPQLPDQSPACPPDPIDRIVALIEVVLVALAGSITAFLAMVSLGVAATELFSDARRLVLLMFLEAAVTLVLIVLLLRLRQTPRRAIGLRLTSVPTQIKVAVAVIPLLFILTFSISAFFKLFLPQWASDTNPMLDLIGSHGDLVLFALASIAVGGVKEEVQRAFVLIRFESHLGGIGLGLAAWTLFFGFGHVIQGIDNAVGAGALGLVFGLLFIWTRNLVAPMIAHALYNLLTLVIFWNFFRWP